MPIAIAVHRPRVDREQQVVGSHQRLHQQAPVDLQPDHDLVGLVGMLGQPGVQRGPPIEGVVDPELGQHLAVRVLNADVVVGFGPVDPDEDHHAPVFDVVVMRVRRASAAS